LKRICRDLISIISRNLSSGTDKSHKHLSEEQRCELGTFRIQYTTLLGADNIKMLIRETQYEWKGLIWLTLVTGSDPL
jgi:hypothetical protein